MKPFKKIVTINVDLIQSAGDQYIESYVVLFNPSIEKVRRTVAALGREKMLIWIFCTGLIENVADYSELPAYDCVVRPFYLGCLTTLQAHALAAGIMAKVYQKPFNTQVDLLYGRPSS